MKEDLLKIIKHYGLMKQLKYIHSEYFELDEAVMDFEYTNVNKLAQVEHIAEELADVMVMLKQFQYYYGIDDEQVEKIMNEKIERQLERIDKENK